MKTSTARDMLAQAAQRASDRAVHLASIRRCLRNDPSMTVSDIARRCGLGRESCKLLMGKL